MSHLALQLARRFEPRHLAFALIALIASFAVLHVVYDRALDSLVAFQLEDSNPAVRNSFPAVVVALLLLGAGALALAVGNMRNTARPTWWRAGAVVCFLFAVDQ